VDRVRVNEKIRVPQIRVIDDEGNQLGIMRPEDALREAVARGLDLVEVAAAASPPVCRIMDYGKFKYQQSKRAKESKKHQHQIVVKEVKYRPKISDHDFDCKTSHVREFLREGNKVKITIMFRGREAAHPEFGHGLLARVVEAAKEEAHADSDPRVARLEGRNMSLVLSPTR
jgi:translation initiation factor IF-3